MHPFYGFSSQLVQDSNYWWLGLASMAMYLLFWAVAIIIAVRFVKEHFLQKEFPTREGGSAISILCERYARGEIDPHEFQERLKDIEGALARRVES